MASAPARAPVEVAGTRCLGRYFGLPRYDSNVRNRIGLPHGRSTEALRCAWLQRWPEVLRRVPGPPAIPRKTLFQVPRYRHDWCLPQMSRQGLLGAVGPRLGVDDARLRRGADQDERGAPSNPRECVGRLAPWERTVGRMDDPSWSPCAHAAVGSKGMKSWPGKAQHWHPCRSTPTLTGGCYLRGRRGPGSPIRISARTALQRGRSRNWRAHTSISSRRRSGGHRRLGVIQVRTRPR